MLRAVRREGTHHELRAAIILVDRRYRPLFRPVFVATTDMTRRSLISEAPVPKRLRNDMHRARFAIHPVFPASHSPLILTGTHCAPRTNPVRVGRLQLAQLAHIRPYTPILSTSESINDRLLSPSHHSPLILACQHSCYTKWTMLLWRRDIV